MINYFKNIQEFEKYMHETVLVDGDKSYFEIPNNIYIESFRYTPDILAINDSVCVTLNTDFKESVFDTAMGLEEYVSKLDNIEDICGVAYILTKESEYSYIYKNGCLILTKIENYCIPSGRQ